MTGPEESESRPLRQAQEWYDSFQQPNGRPPKPFVICVGLVLAERMKSSFPIQDRDIKGTGNRFRSTGSMVRNILHRFGEDRVLLREGARTMGPSVPAAESLAGRLNAINELSDMSAEQRVETANALQEWFAGRAKEYLDRNPIQPEVDLRKPLTVFVRDLLNAGIQRDRSGAVAQHLVGAKLALRHGPDGIEVGNFPFQAADAHTGRRGDFQINSGVFHVTMAPSEDVVLKCQDDLRGGALPVLLVPKESVGSAERFLQAKGLLDRVFLVSIETFVAQNITELSQCDKSKLREEVEELIDEYNRRVVAAESDMSILVELPDLS